MNAIGIIVDAKEAHHIGLVNQVNATDELERKVDEYLDRVRKLSRPVVRLAKRVTACMTKERVMAHLDEAEKLYLDELMKLSDSHEGIATFVAKREPQWQHA